MSRRTKIVLIVGTAGLALLVLAVLYAPYWIMAWADNEK